MVGGHDGSNYLSSIELFPRPPSDTCSIPDLPQLRSRHSLSLLSGGRLVVCGGYNGGSLDSCISWVAGNTSWTPFHTMSVRRSGPTAWTPPSLPDSIVLLGGCCSCTLSTAEFTAETVPGGGSFCLHHNGYEACGIPDAAYRFPRVFGDEFGDKFGDKLSDSLNLVSNVVTNLVMNLVNHHIL